MASDKTKLLAKNERNRKLSLQLPKSSSLTNETNRTTKKERRHTEYMAPKITIEVKEDEEDVSTERSGSSARSRRRASATPVEKTKKYGKDSREDSPSAPHQRCQTTFLAPGNDGLNLCRHPASARAGKRVMTSPAVNNNRSQSEFGLGKDRWKAYARECADKVYEDLENGSQDKWTEYVKREIGKHNSPLLKKAEKKIVPPNPRIQSVLATTHNSSGRSSSASSDASSDSENEDKDEIIKKLQDQIKELKTKTPSPRKKENPDNSHDSDCESNSEDEHKLKDNGEIRIPNNHISVDSDTDDESDEEKSKSPAKTTANCSDGSSSDEDNKTTVVPFSEIHSDCQQQDKHADLDENTQTGEPVVSVIMSVIPDIIPNPKAEGSDCSTNIVPVPKSNHQLTLHQDSKRDLNSSDTNSDYSDIDKNAEVDETLLATIIPLGCSLIDLRKQKQEIRKRSVILAPDPQLIKEKSGIDSDIEDILSVEIDIKKADTSLDNSESLKENKPIYDTNDSIGTQKKTANTEDILDRLERQILDDHENKWQIKEKSIRKQSQGEEVDALLNELNIDA